MSKGQGYVKRLSEKECIGRLDHFLKIIGEGYGFLWKGNPSLIEQYGGNDIEEFCVDSGKEIMLASGLPGNYHSLGIVKKNNVFLYHVDSYGDESFIIDSKTTFSTLKEQFNLKTEYFFDKMAKSIEEGITFILESELEEKVYELRSGLKKIV